MPEGTAKGPHVSKDCRITLHFDGPMARLRLARPEKRNAIDQAMWEAIPALIEAADADPSVRVLILQSSEPGIFCAGADIAEFAAQSGSAAWRAANQAAIRKTQITLARATKPSIAVIDGDCVGGGCGLALACDMRIASPKARLGITPAKLGLVYSLHDTKLLVDLVGPAHAKRMLYTGVLHSADEALRIGLVNAVAQDPLAAAEGLAAEIIAAAPSSQQATKRIIRRILDGEADDNADSAALFDAAFTGADFAEGVSAFLAKRRPRFPG